MKCPVCDSWSEVKETRSPKRKRVCANGHMFWTKEEWVQADARSRRAHNPPKTRACEQEMENLAR